MERPSSDPRSRQLYLRAKLYGLLGNTSRASRLCRAALAIADHEQARKLLSRLELPGEDYFRVLERIHAHLRPRNYIEIGIWKGKSLRLARPATLALGVDPAPQLKVAPGPNVHLFPETSDDFFAKHDVVAELAGRRLELALIDGMHHFEYALRDFMNLERVSDPQSIVLVHDCCPLDAQSAQRERTTVFWSGDVWRMIVLLRKYRPDLSVHTIAAPPTGLGIILNLDPSSQTLAQNFDAIVAEGLALDYAALEGRKVQLLNLYPNSWRKIRELIDSRRSPARE
jgi:hypothetical protein